MNSKEFKKWSSTTSRQKMQAVRKVKSSRTIYDSDPSERRNNGSSFPHYPTSGPSTSTTTHYDAHKSRGQEHGRKQSQQSQSSVASGHSESGNMLNLNGVSSSSEDLNFIKENTASFLPQHHGPGNGGPYGDYMSPSPKQTPTQLTKMWQNLPNAAYIGNLSNKSSSTNNSERSMTPLKSSMAVIHRNTTNISSVHYEILQHLELGIQTIENKVPRELLKEMNQGMVKITLEFCGFDIENEAKFNPLYTQLEELLKIQNVHSIHNTSKMSYFVYSGPKLLEFLHTAKQSLTAFIHDPPSNQHKITAFIDVLWSYHAKRGVSSISILTLISYFELCREFKVQQDQMRELQGKLAVVRKLFDDDSAKKSRDSSPSMASSNPPPVDSTESIIVYSAQNVHPPTHHFNPSRSAHSSRPFPPPQHPQHPQHQHPPNSTHTRSPRTAQKVRRRFPVQGPPPPKHQALSVRPHAQSASTKRPHPMNKSKSHPTPSSPTKPTPSLSPSAALSKSDHSDRDREPDEFVEQHLNGETTPVLSDNDDIEQYLAAVIPPRNGYDSDLQSEMSATPQPADMAHTVIPAFMPNANLVGPMDDVMQQIEELPSPRNRDGPMAVHGSPTPTLQDLQIVDLPRPPPEIKTMQSDMTEVSNDADDELSAGSSAISSTDDTSGDGNGFKTIKTLTPDPTPHSRSSQIIVYSDTVNQGDSAGANGAGNGNKSVHPVAKKRPSRRQSQTEIAVMEQIDIRYEAKSAFTMIQPIDQQQSVNNLIRSSRNSLGQNALKDDVEQLRKEYEAALGSGSENEEGHIVDVQDMSDTASTKQDEDEDDFLDDHAVTAMRNKYVSMTSTTDSPLPIQPQSLSASTSAFSPGLASTLHDEASGALKGKRYPLRATKSMSHQMLSSSMENRYDSTFGDRTYRNQRNNDRSHSYHESESEMSAPRSGHGRHPTNDTAPSNRSGSSMAKKESVSFYAHSKHRQIVTNTEDHHDHRDHHNHHHEESRHRRRHGHSRSTSDFVGSSYGKRTPKTLQFVQFEEREDSEDRMSALSGSPGAFDTVSSGDGGKNGVRRYEGKRSHDDSHYGAGANRAAKRKKKRTIMASKSERIRQNYVVRSQYVDSHKAMGKYALDRNKSWRKWIQLLQSHDNDIANVRATEQVQALIDFARMSLGNYGNWLKMKSGSFPHSGSASSGNWTTVFAVMRDFNIFLFDRQLSFSTLHDVVKEEYNALALAHFESVRQCTSNPLELYLEMTGSKTNHQIKLRCETEEDCKQWVAEINYQIHIVSDLFCNQSLRLEYADQKRSIWIPVAPPLSKMAMTHHDTDKVSLSLNAASKQHRSRSARKLPTRSAPTL